MEQSEKISLLTQKDEVFASEHYPKPFVFNEEVAKVFDDMVLRSIPLYREAVDLTACWIKKLYQPGTRIYDIGCSTGTVIEVLARMLPVAQFVGIDTSSEMLEVARKKLAPLEDQHRIFLQTGDALDVPMSQASAVVMNYTLQFIPVARRKKLVEKIYDSLLPGGLLVVSDKIHFIDPQIQETTTHLYEEFKQRNGYSRLEIERKKEALDQVLIPYTYEQEYALLKDAGFASVSTILQWQNFVTMIALKS